MELTYDELFTYSHLYQSFLKARKNKRDKDEVLSYQLNLENNLIELEKRMKKRAFPFSGYYSFTIYEPKTRQIQAIHFQDRILEHCLCDYYLVPLLERHLIYDNGATRIGKGTDFSRNRLRNFLNSYYLHKGDNKGFVLKFDIHKYFPSIEHNRLKEKLSNIVKDKDILSYLFFLIDTYHEKDSLNRGLPIGNQSSQCFGLLYLNQVDRIIKNKCRMHYYLRYMDDGIVISSSKDELKEVLFEVEEQLEKDCLVLNSKTKIYKLDEGFAFLGFNYRMKNDGQIIQTLPKKNKERIIRYVKKRIKEEGYYDFQSYGSYLKRGNCKIFLKKLISLSKIN